MDWIYVFGVGSNLENYHASLFVLQGQLSFDILFKSYLTTKKSRLFCCRRTKTKE
jgi:hypothetical protein